MSNTPRVRPFSPALLTNFASTPQTAPAEAAEAKTEPSSSQSEAPENQITPLYDAFGRDPSMKKDWGFSALIEVGGKRVLFDTGNNSAILAHNVEAKGVDLTKLDFVVM